MTILLVICISILIFAIMFYDKWSYKSFEKRSKINAKHPNWKPYCGVNYFKKDPQWFVDNGYGEYVGY